MGRTWASMMGEQMAGREVVWIAGLQSGLLTRFNSVLEHLGNYDVD